MAATSRQSILIGWVPPTGMISRSCSARSSLTWVASGMSPTSSRKNVPPSATWNSPAASRTAPVNEPFTCPNRLLSSRSRGMAPQLMLTNGPCDLPLR